MSADSSEMFFQEYWGFDHPNTIAKGLDSDITFSNSSIPLLDTLLQPPVLPHSSSSSSAPLLLRALYRRSFTCPTGTNSCASIGASYGCCPVGTTCVAASTTLIVVSPIVTVTASTSPSSSSIPPSTSATPTSTPSTSTIPTGSSIPPSTTPKSTQPSAPLPPIAPTSLQGSTLTTSLPPVTTTILPCPTGFYQCSAYLAYGGCCQVGRDCASSSCPALGSTSLLVSDGVSVGGVAPTATAGGGGGKGVCATGWSSCGASVGGGCCPSGWACGTASCSVTASATGTGVPVVSSIGKVDSAAGERLGEGRGRWRWRWQWSVPVGVVILGIWL
ncbi:hypothetical protein MMC10_006570 [Thelotrema lepadinum]|nr:hypothetical protein [Thelotrema lepadinum]